MSKPLRNFWGWDKEAGVRNWRVVKRRYQRHCEYYRFLDVNWKSRWLAVAFVAIGFSIFIFITSAQAAEFSLRPRYPLMEGSLALAISGIFGGAVAEVAFRLHCWNLAYGNALAFENLSLEHMLYRLPDFWEGPLVTLGFADRYGFKLGGSAANSSVNNANIFLILPEGVSPESVRHPRDLYALDALDSDFNTVPSREAWSMFLKALEYGEVLKMLGRDRLKDLLEEGVPWIVLGGGMIIIFLMSAIATEGGA